MRRLLVLLVALAAGSLLLSQTEAAQQPVDVVPGRYIVVLDAGASPAAVAADHGLARIHTCRAALNGFTAVIPPQALSAVARDPRVAFVEPDRAYTVADQTTPTGIDRIEADENPAAAITATHTSPRVEVLVQDLNQGPAELAEGSLFRLQLTGQGLRAQDGLSRGHYLSPALSSSFPFTHVGIHWRSNRPEGSSVAFSVQTSKDGVSWGPWHPVHVEAFPGEAADDETYGALIRADRANSVRFRADFPADEDNLAVEYVVLTLLNVYDGPPLPGPPLSAAEMAVEAGEVKPIDFAREEWGADESLRFRGGREIWPRAYVSTKKVVVHHTVTGNDYETVEDAKADVRAIYTYHARTLRWGDIGYNSLVDKFGNSYEGRYGRDDPDGREILSEDMVAGHALAHNYGSTGVALLGTFCSTDECTGGADPSDDMIERLKEILVWESRQHGIDPHGASDFLLSTDAWNRGLDNICGHRDCTSTICPGGTVYALLPSLRDHVAAHLRDTSAPTVTITAHPPEDTVDDGDASYPGRGLAGLVTSSTPTIWKGGSSPATGTISTT